VTYSHKLLEPILAETYGCMVYQEQIMRIVRDMAGYSMARSDLVRRAMSKKQQAVLEKERKAFIYGDREQGIDGALKRGMSERDANELFDQMMAFANYAFNKSHACAYAVVAYQTAYLKRYYPVEFMTALLNSFISSKQKLSEYIQYLKKAGVKVLPPDINRSRMRFCTEDGSIRFGLSAIMNVGEAIDEVIENRDGEYADFQDFVTKNAEALNKKRLESLILSGCFDCFGNKRSQLIAIYDQALQEAVQTARRQATGQLSLFDGGGFGMLKTKMPEMDEYKKSKLLAYEKEMTGLYISGHPLDEYEEELKKRPLSIIDIMKTGDSEISMYEFDGRAVELVGSITDMRVRQTKQKKFMCNMALEDLYSRINVIAFPQVYSKYEHLIQPDAVVLVSGKITVTAQAGIELLAEKISRYMPDESFYAGKQLFVKIDADHDVDDLMKVAAAHPGASSAVVYVESTGQKYKLTGGRSVRYCVQLVERLKDALGEANVIVR
jgi:DNA polymerase-3 subunit alpha